MNTTVLLGKNLLWAVNTLKNYTKVPPKIYRPKNCYAQFCQKSKIAALNWEGD
jgi:hypothetical protein